MLFLATTSLELSAQLAFQYAFKIAVIVYFYMNNI